MREARQRKFAGRKTNTGDLRSSTSPPVPNENQVSSTDLAAKTSQWIQYVNIILGVSVAVFVGVKYTTYIRQLHENDMWFSNIKQVEREISFRTESGLYFSYYKQLVLAPSISQGLHDLIHDNKTEHLRTINILERFNIYQEVILGILYKLLPIQNSVEYVYFYLNTIFGLHGMYMMSLFATTWIISRSWIAGFLSVTFFVFNRVDTTRISFTLPLRESFGFPFLYAQIAFLTYFLKPRISQVAKVFCLIGVTFCTFFFVLSWQFAQFILLLQSFALFGVYALGFIHQTKVMQVFSIMTACLLSVCVLQFGNDMIPSSLVLSFIIGCIAMMTFKKESNSSGNILSKFLSLIAHIVAVLLLMVVINVAIKMILRVESDEHIYKFLLSKLGYGGKYRDFDAMMYLCEPAFVMLPFDTLVRLTEGIVLPCYVIAVVVVLALLLYTVLLNWSSEESPSSVKDLKYPVLNSRPELIYTVIQTVFFGIMALSTLRFKFLWTPHVCVVGAGVFCDQTFWLWVLKHVKITGNKAKMIGLTVPSVLIGLVLLMRFQEYKAEADLLKEFYDPDTVELMEWIKAETPPGSSFSGSMQLMSAVKLSTDQPITNHPHYENKFLRQRTKELYQIYGRKKSHEVHTILKKHGSNYIILENSICYTRGPIGCRLTDIMDINNGHPIDNNVNNEGMKNTPVPRFCDAIRNNHKFSKHFKKVFENPTFYIYKVL